MKKLIRFGLVAASLLVSGSSLAVQISSCPIEKVNIVQEIQIIIEQVKYHAIKDANDERIETDIYLAYCKRFPNNKRCKDWFGPSWPLPPLPDVFIQ